MFQCGPDLDQGLQQLQFALEYSTSSSWCYGGIWIGHVMGQMGKSLLPCCSPAQALHSWSKDNYLQSCTPVIPKMMVCNPPFGTKTGQREMVPKGKWSRSEFPDSTTAVVESGVFYLTCGVVLVFGRVGEACSCNGHPTAKILYSTV